MELIHLNTAGAGLMSAETTTAVQEYLSRETQVGSYEAELEYTDLLNVKIYERLAQLLNCSSIDIALFSSGTEAWLSVMNKLYFPSGSRIWVSQS